VLIGPVNGHLPGRRAAHRYTPIITLPSASTYLIPNDLTKSVKGGQLSILVFPERWLMTWEY
jgi:hypothetical protein